ncbi:18065_t:CDS:2, partial [Racocetra persica]
NDFNLEFKNQIETKGKKFSLGQYKKIREIYDKFIKKDRKFKQLLDKKVGVSTVNEFVNARSKAIKAIKVDEAFKTITTTTELNAWDICFPQDFFQPQCQFFSFLVRNMDHHYATLIEFCGKCNHWGTHFESQCR